MIVGYHSNAFPRTVASTLLDAVQMYWVRAVKMFRKMLLMLKCFTPVQMCSIKIAIKTCSWKWKCYVKNVCFFLARFHTADSIYSKMRSENVSILLDVLSPKRWKCFAGTQNALKMFRASSSVFNTNVSVFFECDSSKLPSRNLLLILSEWHEMLAFVEKFASCRHAFNQQRAPSMFRYGCLHEIL